MKFLKLNTTCLLLATLIALACQKDPDDRNIIISDYTGTYKNIEYSTKFLGEFVPGIYNESEISDEIKQLRYGRIEIAFNYDGGGSSTFMPLFYYGSVNKNEDDNAVEKTGFHLAVEIGHYNVIPVTVDYLFYTISSFRQPLYCRDTWCPVVPGVDYTLSIDKKPEGIILQLLKGDTIINAFPHAFFPDSAGMFFSDVTSCISNNRGDSLETVMMVGKGFAGIDLGLHEFHGQISSLRIYSYTPAETVPGYEIYNLKNQLTEDQELDYCINDPDHGSNNFIRVKYEFRPYKFISEGLIPFGEKRSGESEIFPENLTRTTILNGDETGFYQITLQTLDDQGNILKESLNPFEFWIYPKEWYFDYY